MRDDPVDVPLGTPPAKNVRIVFPTYKPGENRHYRLPVNLVTSTPLHSQPVRFWFRTRYISATGRIISPVHPDVLRLTIHRSAILRFLGFCFKPLLSFAKPWIRIIFPEWFLPDNVVLKPRRKGEEEFFDTELKAYRYLESAQGTLVPKLYGQVGYNGTKALLLQDLGGIPLASPEGAMLELVKVSELLQECFLALHRLGVHQLDPNPGNYQLVGEKLMALDFGDVDFDLSEDDKQYFMMTRISSILKYYRELQLFYEHDNKLVPVTDANEYESNAQASGFPQNA